MDSIKKLSKVQINKIIDYTTCFKTQSHNDAYYVNDIAINFSNKFLCNAFFESSTRTSMSFETAMLKLGGKVINFDRATSSLKKGESFEDTIKTIQEFCDILVLRHPDIECINKASKFCKVPIINGGNGAGEHPTQALLDFYTIRENIDMDKPFHICFIGDIKYSRTIHSLIDLLIIMEIQCIITFCCYTNCYPEKTYVDRLKKHFGLDNIYLSLNLYDNIQDYDVCYCTRNQSERHGDNNNLNNKNDNENENGNGNEHDYDVLELQINKKVLSFMKSDAIILHPLPRNMEIHPDIDDDKRAKYFDQVKNGVYVRMAILYDIFNNNK